MTEMKVATPQQMIEAWEVGVMYGHLARAKDEAAKYPIDIPDPTFYRDDVGWHSASTISRGSAIAQMRNYLSKQGLVAPEATEAAWEERLRRNKILEEIQGTVDEALREADRLLEHPEREDFARAITGALRAS